MTLKEQKKLGGDPDQCSVYELLLFHLIPDDEEVAEIYSECKNGNLICGACKTNAAVLMAAFLHEHQELREIARDQLDEYGLTGK